jgi:hypothetical protein
MIIGEAIVGSSTELRNEFIEFCEGSQLEHKMKMEIYKDLVVKVCHARFGAVLRKYKDKTVGRQGAKRTAVTLRGELKPVKTTESIIKLD